MACKAVPPDGTACTHALPFIRLCQCDIILLSALIFSDVQCIWPLGMQGGWLQPSGGPNHPRPSLPKMTL
eukprot:349892-Pelagomonas_calceolata.AAC.2